MKYLFLILVFMLAGCNNPAMAATNRIVAVAQSQLGKGEIGGDNRGQYVKKYTHGKETAWCAGFVSWVIREAGYKEPYLLSAKTYWKSFHNKRITHPRPGDIICFYRGSRGGRQGHVGIVKSVRGMEVYTIEGNVGRYPAVVKEFHYRIGSIPHLLGFVRVQ